VLDGDFVKVIMIRCHFCICSDYGFEANGDDCVAASWFNASVPVTTCRVGSQYRASSGLVYL